MNSERWQKVKGLFDAVVELSPQKREQFLDKSCGNDEELRRDVENLLDSYNDAESFMEQAAVVEVAGLIIEPKNLEAGKSFGHYEIIKQIGMGGMGEVYLAEDKKLDRKVAVKILNEKFAKHESNLQRFIKEAKAVSALNHPNILVIHEIGEAEETNYIVSEFIEGKTLRDIIVKTSLKLSEILDISTQIANALVATHTAKIVHRDIKPENIMIRPDGYVKILDFGLAKLAEQKAVGMEDTTAKQNQTAKGIILGTVNYMSPEQAKAEKIDERTDIFSFGVVLYEMVAGRTPSAGGSMSETLANLINSEPQPLSRFAANVPDELQRIVAKTLRKNKDERYQTMKDLLTDLKKLRENLAFNEKLERSRPPSVEKATAFLQAATGDVDNQTNEASNNSTGQIKSRKSLVIFAFAILLIAAVGFGYYFLSVRKTALSATGKKSLAVLPFVNAGNDPNAEYLSDGITESVINNLSQFSGLKVMSRNSAFRFRDNQTDTKTIASQLGVENIVTGDIKQVGDKLVINVRLIDATDDSQIWGNQYVKTSVDVIAAQNEIARDISRKLGARLSGADEQKLARKFTENTEAYQAYLRGLYHSEKSGTQDKRKALEYFQQAVTLDPNFAAAHAYLSARYANLAGANGFPRRETMLKAKETALKAVALDDQLSMAHEALGYVLVYSDYDFVAAERELKRAIELDPNDASGRETYSGILTSFGRNEEAIAEMRQAAELNPLSPSVSSSLGYSLLYARRYDEAIAQFKKTLELDAYFIALHYGLAIAYQMQKKYAESVEERAQITEITDGKQGAAFIRESFANGGWQGFLRAMTENSQTYQAPRYIKATMYAELGEKDKAFSILHNLYEDRSAQLLRLKVDPRLDSLRDDARFTELLKRMNLE